MSTQMTDEHRDFLALLARCLLSNGKSHKALSLYRALLTIAPGERRYQLNTAFAALEEGQPREALRLIEDYLSQGEDGNIYAHLVRSKALWALGNESQARLALETFLKEGSAS